MQCNCYTELLNKINIFRSEIRPREVDIQYGEENVRKLCVKQTTQLVLSEKNAVT